MAGATLVQLPAEVRKAAARREVGNTLWRDLHALEEAIQTASERAAVFSASLARAPKQAELAPGYAQGVVARAAQAIVMLADARGAIGVAHEGLERARKDLEVELIWPFDDGFGTQSTPPDKPPPPSGTAEVLTISPEGRIA